jgi:hypothetical protein
MYSLQKVSHIIIGATAIAKLSSDDAVDNLA